VRDRLIGRALSEGYRSILPHGVYPAALLFIEVPLEEVDVNVHPAKTEVRFRRAAAVADAVREAVRAGLASAGYAPANEIRDTAPAAFDAAEVNKRGNERSSRGRRSTSRKLHSSSTATTGNELDLVSERRRSVRPRPSMKRNQPAAEVNLGRLPVATAQLNTETVNAAQSFPDNVATSALSNMPSLPPLDFRTQICSGSSGGGRSARTSARSVNSTKALSSRRNSEGLLLNRSARRPRTGVVR